MRSSFFLSFTPFSLQKVLSGQASFFEYLHLTSVPLNLQINKSQPGSDGIGFIYWSEQNWKRTLWRRITLSHLNSLRTDLCQSRWTLTQFLLPKNHISGLYSNVKIHTDTEAKCNQEEGKEEISITKKIQVLHSYLQILPIIRYCIPRIQQNKSCPF